MISHDYRIISIIQTLKDSFTSMRQLMDTQVEELTASVTAKEQELLDQKEVL